jgi:hypothetical protein
MEAKNLSGKIFALKKSSREYFSPEISSSPTTAPLIFFTAAELELRPAPAQTAASLDNG